MTPHGLMRRWLADPAATPTQRAHAAWRLTLPDTPPPPARRLLSPYSGPMPTCLYASPGLTGGCNPVRCWANRGVTCGGSHSTPDHCSRCLKGD